MTIRPYKDKNLAQWVFDEPSLGLRKEAFVSGADDMLVSMANKQGIENPEAGIKVIFGCNPFPGFQFELCFNHPEHGGVWYRCSELNDAKGWLCPAVTRFFRGFPASIYIAVLPTPPVDQGTPLEGGVDLDDDFEIAPSPDLPPLSLD
jgi:hypothetical protein